MQHPVQHGRGLPATRSVPLSRVIRSKDPDGHLLPLQLVVYALPGPAASAVLDAPILMAVVITTV